MRGVDGTLYGRLNIDIFFIFPTNYPFRPPRVVFLPILFHPNVNPATGILELPSLFDDWCPAYTLLTLLVYIQSLLEDPYICKEETMADLGKGKEELESQEEIRKEKYVCANPYAAEFWGERSMMREHIQVSLEEEVESVQHEQASYDDMSPQEIELLFARIYESNEK